jgi:5-methylcytosine-specific restriction endonuclease McrA
MPPGKRKKPKIKNKKSKKKKVKRALKNWLGIRFEIFKRDNFTCQYCGRKVVDGIKLHCDHVHPVCKGGDNSSKNLITACSDCNIGKKFFL